MFPQTMSDTAARVAIFLVFYAINLVGFYELSRMVCIGFCSVIHVVKCINTVLKIGPLFVTKIRKLYDLQVLIMWYKFCQVQFAIAEYVVRNTIFLMLTTFCTFLTLACYILIRLHAERPDVVMLQGTFALMGFALVF